MKVADLVAQNATSQRIQGVVSYLNGFGFDPVEVDVAEDPGGGLRSIAVSAQRGILVQTWVAQGWGGEDYIFWRLMMEIDETLEQMGLLLP